MKKKRSIGKRLCYSTIAALFLLAVCGNLHASNNVLQVVQEVEAGVTASGLTLAATDDLVGTWIIDQIKIKKTVNGVVSENTYSLKLKQKFESFTDCPKTITFTADGKIIFEYNDKEPNEASYTVEGNKITRMTLVAGYEYEFVLTDTNKIQLLYSIDYVYNHANNEGIDNITEEYTFLGIRN